ncbi:uncharacterized protein L969DRAFT_70160 [Mixia osmundae IAM 14324]|uniref:AMP-dependent synthetase/ligase domain-containing protein n=1 Tax=Mixia osmundae (strain CBS 9802 / IAM 14324 / JCM 22182 / KY 12970) TaxID=764103 RepID=G7DTN7_MIXOS|nr:uncharacterized protein L969DRAFT_70160 [Mixia osmundae IAM 14324]KEI42782.1 hypothetical protein L969DRAFT_70160 [Mixia osmundae IAM 14324]GAA93884.1 hypothetical protein E5Q_00530 [Mixia osmundae IAM 14324]
MHVYKSIYTAPELPEQSVFDYLFGHSRKLPREKVALTNYVSKQSMTYGQLVDACLDLASGLRKVAGLKVGDMILAFSPNSIEYPVVLLGGQAAGLPVSTANSAYTPRELAHQIRDSGAKLLLVASDLVPIAQEALKSVDGKIPIYVLPGVDGKIANISGCKSWEELNKPGSGKGFEHFTLPKDKVKKTMAYLPYSSGTTGLAKGVELSHHTITSMCCQAPVCPGMALEQDIISATLPFYHIYGLQVLLHNVLDVRGSLIILPRFDLVQFCQSIQEHKITIAYVVPPMALALAKHPIIDKFNLKTLRNITSGAAPLSPELHNALQKRLGKQTVITQGYGLTESDSTSHVNPVHDSRPGTIGPLFVGLEARLVDVETGEDAKEGERGELWMRGPTIMMGYHNNDKANKETFEGDWLKTGDIAIVRDNWWQIVDRAKELIKTQGYQVPPAELEGVLLDCPLVADSAVIGVWSEENATEYPRAYIVVDPKAAEGKDVEKEVYDFVASKVAHYKRLKGGVCVIDVIPKSASGKILRKDLRERAKKEGLKAKM